MVSKVLFSSKSDEWATPKELYNLLDAMYFFNLDPCATQDNAKCKRYFTIKDNGLIKSWGRSRAFVNPPYSKIAEWCEKSYHAAMYGAFVAMLIPARTDTKYWHKYIMRADKVYMIRGRLKFNESNNSATFPSCVPIFQPYTNNPIGPLMLPMGRNISEHVKITGGGP